MQFVNTMYLMVMATAVCVVDPCSPCSGLHLTHLGCEEQLGLELLHELSAVIIWS